MPEANLAIRDIIAPSDPHWWPPAPGWWIVFTIAVVLLTLAGMKLARLLRSDYAGLRKAALRELGQLEADTKLTDSQFVQQLSALLKRVAIARYSAQQPGALSGHAWLNFLDQSHPGYSFSQQGGDALLDAHYRSAAKINRTQLLTAARTWISKI